MKIGIDCRALSVPMCGIARYLANLLDALSKIDYQNSYFLFSDRDFLIETKLGDNFQKIVLQGKRSLIWEQFILPSALMRQRVDIFHCPQNHGVPFNKKWKVILTLYDLIPKLFPFYWRKRSRFGKIMYHLSLGMSVGRADKIIAVSQNSRQDIINTFHLPEDKVEFIYGGVDARFKSRNLLSIEAVHKKYGINKSYLMHISGMGFNKNTEMVLSAYQKLRNDNNFPFLLVIVGNKGWIGRELLKKAEEIGEVVFTDHIKDEEMPLLYQGASVFLYPSTYEGFGFPALEAMACSVPVIVSRSSSLPEVVEDAGLYVDPYNSNDLAQKILLILNDGDLKTQLIQKGLKRVEEFSWQKAAKETLRVYESVTN